MALNENRVGDSPRREYVFERTMNAPRPLVFDAYTQSEHLQHWWGPKGMAIKVRRFDLRPGGDFFYSMALPDGSESFGKLVYREIEAPTRLVFVVSFTDADGNPVRHRMAATWPLEVMVTLSFIEQDGKTLIQAVSTPINALDEEHTMFESAFEGMNIGNGGMYDNFAAYLETLQKSKTMETTKNMSAKQKVGLTVTDRALMLTRIFAAPRALVYKVWTDPAHFARWWGPHTYTNPVCTIELHVGGKFQVTMRSPEGEENPLKGEFLEIAHEQKIVFTMDTTDHPKAWHEIVNAARGLASDAAAVNLLMTVVFEDCEGGTKLTMEQRFENTTDRDAFIQLGTAEGAGQSFVKMDSLLATLATDREFVQFRTLDAPISLVWKVFSDPVHLAKWWGPNGFKNTITAFDLRTNGEWLYTMHGPDGTDYPNWMHFDEVVEGEKIVYTHGSFPGDPNAFHGRISFTDEGEGKTGVKLHLRMASAEVRDGAFAYGAFEGGDQTLSRWNAYLGTM